LHQFLTFVAYPWEANQLYHDMSKIVITGSQSGTGWAMRQYLESQNHHIIGVDLPGKGAEVAE
jgi:hypothetical protein